MSIKQDAGFILNVLHNKKINGEGEKIDSEKIALESGLDENRIKNALKYLEDKNLISIRLKTLDGCWHIIEITGDGIDIVEHEKEFRRHFEIGANLGLFSFKWGAEE